MVLDNFDDTLDAPDRGWNYEPSRAELFKQITAPAYTTDADGWLTYYNEAAADLWGYRPELGKTRWCGSWRIFTTDGAHLPLDQCPMAVALKEGRAVRGVQAVLERPDGTLIPFMPHPTPLRDASGAIVAGSNVLLPLTAQGSVPPPFNASGDGSDDAQLPDLPDDLELDGLTGCLQRALAAQADVEFGFQIDCERLEAWSGPEAGKERIVRQLESKRQRRRNLLNRRLDQLQQRAKRLIAGSRECEAAAARIITDTGTTLH